jgi:hypothetical protein
MCCNALGKEITMKTNIFCLAILLLTMVSCNETVVDPKVPFEEDTTHKYPDCPLYTFSEPNCDEIISVSYDGKYTAIEKHFESNFTLLSNRWIISNQTGEYMLIGGNQRPMDFDSTLLTQFRYIGLKHYFEFNPYNSNILVFTSYTLVDTVGDKKQFIGRDNLFTYNLQTKELKLITPSAFGKGGAIYLNNEGMRVKWLPESMVGNDVFYIRYNKNTHYKYYLQEDRLEEIAMEPYTTISNDLKLRILMNLSWTNTNKNYIINSKNYFLFDTLEYRSVYASTISFDNKYVALNVASSNVANGVDTNKNYRHIEIWVVEVDKWLASSGEFKDFKKINTRFQHCMYIPPSQYYPPNNLIAFTPQNTLLVSMHPNNSPKGNIYEMDLKGNILRKITNN